MERVELIMNLTQNNKVNYPLLKNKTNEIQILTKNKPKSFEVNRKRARKPPKKSTYHNLKM